MKRSTTKRMGSPSLFPAALFNRRAALALAIGVLLPAGMHAASAQDVYNGGNQNFSTGFTPTLSSGDSILFSSNSGGTASNDMTGLSLSGISFTGAGFTLQGNAITLTGNVVNSSGNDQLIKNNLNITSNVNFNTGAHHLNFGGGTLTGTGITINTNSSSTDPTNNGTVQFGVQSNTELVSLGAGSVINVQTGLLKEDYGNANFNANLASLNITAGAVVDTWDNNFNGWKVDALTGGGTLQHTHYGGNQNFTLGVNNGSGTFSGTITNDGNALTIIKNGTGTETLTGANTSSGGLVVNAGTLERSAGTNSGNGAKTINGGTLLVDGGSITGTAGFTVNGGNLNVTSGSISGITADPALNITGSGTGAAAATATVSGGTVTLGNGELFLGNANGQTGTLTLSGTGALSDAGNYVVGRGGGATGVLNVNGGTLTETSGTQAYGPGSILIGAVGATGTVNQTAGIINSLNTTQNAQFGVGVYGGTGTYTISGGQANLGILTIGDAFPTNNSQFGGSTGIVNLNGGVISTTEVNRTDNAPGGNTGGSSTLNFNGGTLQANTGAVGATFLTFGTKPGTANVKGSGSAPTSGLGTGANIDSNGQAITIAQPLLHGTGAATDGGATFLSTAAGGSTTLTATNTYNGGTTVNSGTLVLAHSGADGTGTLQVNSGAAVKVTVAGGDTSTDPIINGGTYTVSANNALGSPTQILNGGQLVNAGFTGATTANNVQNGGVLTIGTGTNNILDFGSGNTGATFNFSNMSFASGGALQILDWNGNLAPTGGGLDQLFSATPLSAAQLANITFTNPIGNGNPLTGSFAAVQLASGEITASPEPAQTAALGFFGLGLGALVLKARKRQSANTAS